MLCREGDETSLHVERNFIWLLDATIERRDVMAFVSECLQSIVVGVGDDDSTLIGEHTPCGTGMFDRLWSHRSEWYTRSQLNGCSPPGPATPYSPVVLTRAVAVKLQIGPLQCCNRSERAQ